MIDRLQRGDDSMRLTGLAVTLAAILATPALAGGVPPQAMDKTITISFTATGQARSPEGKLQNFNTQVTRIIYVSSAGRLFMRHRASNGKASRGGDFEPGTAARGAGSFSFQGSRLVGVIPYEVGARQITVTFDSSYSSCTASIIEGHSGGVIRRKGPNGMMYEISSATTSTPACSIQSGNVFAG
jgi:hypothetical protein